MQNVNFSDVRPVVMRQRRSLGLVHKTGANGMHILFSLREGGSRKRNEADCGRPEDGGVDSKNSQTTPATTSTTPNTPTTGRRWRTNGTACHIRHSPSTPTTGLRERGNDTSRSTGRSGRQKAATRHNMRREERVTVQGPVKKQQPDGMSHGGTKTNFKPKQFHAALVAYEATKQARPLCRWCPWSIFGGGGGALHRSAPGNPLARHTPTAAWRVIVDIAGTCPGPCSAPLGTGALYSALRCFWSCPWPRCPSQPRSPLGGLCSGGAPPTPRSPSRRPRA